ncbi:uncharacterized protein LOC101845588 isoform X2 [Aplysia californica]|uniref:Uncharacterized protein LOC101845588 isoform X2 n=1 Tax=Aplysia californica TaxID=6500 RepID=A0ABM0ZWJ5_APLCA|nr:uncharacterized protein LOC101845588 isoform X2 [Aplysia californica]
MGRGQHNNSVPLELTMPKLVARSSQMTDPAVALTAQNMTCSREMPSPDSPLDLSTTSLLRTQDQTIFSASSDSDADDDENFEAGHSQEEPMDEPNYATLASMNCNSNGKTDTQEDLKLMEPATFLEDSTFLSKVKHINMGEIPLHPMGLSLSGSGMQLFVKMDASVQKAIVDQSTPKKSAQKKRTTTTKSTKRAVQSTTTQTANVPTPLSRSHDPSSFTGNPLSEQEFRKYGETRMSEPVIRNPMFHSYSLEKSHDFSNNGEADNFRFQKVEHSKRRRPVSPRQVQQFAHPGPVSPRFSRHHAEGPPSRIDTYHQRTQGKQGDEVNSHAHFSGPSWKFQDGQIDVSASKETRFLQSHSRVEHSQMAETIDMKRNKMNRTHIEGFTSRDLPLKRPASPTDCFRGDFSGTKRGNRTERSKPPCSVRGHHGTFDHSSHDRHRPQKTSRRSRVVHQDYNQVYEDYANDEYEDEDDVEIISSRAHLYEKNNSRQRSGCNTCCKDVVVKKECPDIEPMKSHSMSDKSSVGPQFDTSKIPTNALDAETLAKFTEYTKNMRKDLRDNYKSLSILMKDINSVVLERNNTGANQDLQTSVLTGNTDEKQDKQKDPRCSIM